MLSFSKPLHINGASFVISFQQPLHCFQLKPNIPAPQKEKIAGLICAARNIGTHSLAEAADTDTVDSFPQKTLSEIAAAGLLTASIAPEYGGQNLGLIPGTNFALLTLLKHIGSGNLVMGRLLEGHINAQLLIHQFGSKAQKSRFAADAFAGRLFGVWNTQAQDGTFLTCGEENRPLLNGTKTFATGTGYVTRPIVTAAQPNGDWQMCIVPLEEVPAEADSGWWQPMGMKATRSYKMTFDSASLPAENLLGTGGDYYQQPAFSGGAIRFAAVQLGAAERLTDETRTYLCSLGRAEDPYQNMRVGQMTIAVTSGNQWLQGAAEQLDAYLKNATPENSKRFLAYANMMRTAIEGICAEVMALCQKCVGARGLNKPYHFERIIRDLSTYLRQPAPDAALADVGRYMMQTEVPAGGLWEVGE